MSTCHRTFFYRAFIHVVIKILSHGATDRQVVESGSKLNLRRDFGDQKDSQVHAKSQAKTKPFKTDYPLFH